MYLSRGLLSFSSVISMRGAILYSTTNPASMNIVRHLEQDWHWKKESSHLLTFSPCTKGDCHCGVEARGYDQEIIAIEPDFPASYYLYASTHKSAAGKPALTAHIPGNWAAADFGGQPRTLNLAYASKQKQILQLLAEGAARHKLDWPVDMEVDHHGPTPGPMKTKEGEKGHVHSVHPSNVSGSPSVHHPPMIFVEIGSGPEQWENELAGKVVAEAMMKALFRPAPECKVYLGLGGGHYAPKFTPLMIKGEEAVGHVLPKHHAASFDAAMLRQAIEKTQEKVEGALIDWKGLPGEQRDRIVTLLDEEGLMWKKF
jgi:D-aminoacyl-tRNA deacylase